MVSYIFVTGGVISSIGKGIVVASIGRMLKGRRVSVVPLKLDPYLNVDPGTMSPYQHGEVFVTVDGRETDLDLGHYERFIDVELSSNSNVTAGEMYRELIRKERDGQYLGGTIQTVPHVTNAIQDHIKDLARKTDAEVVVVEVGGTVGDIECQPFLEAIRQLRNDPTAAHCFYVHLTLMPRISNGELKTKPTQHSVQTLRSMGIQPDMVMCRADGPVSKEVCEKVSIHCDVPVGSVIGLPHLDNVYGMPIYLEEQGVGDIIAKHLKIRRKAQHAKWRKATRYGHERKEVEIAIVGKYVELPDSYLSVVEALRHAAHANNHKLKLRWVVASDISVPVEQHLGAASGILVPGGFDQRGVVGMELAAEFARERNIPYLGICLGLHIMIIEFARNVLGLSEADSVEFNPDTPHPVIDLMPEQDGLQQTGGTMRLGSWECHLAENSYVRKIYGTDKINERHRHRYEVNNKYIEPMRARGLNASGHTANGKLVEMCELSDHKFMVGCQFHPEFASRPDRPHPLFKEFVRQSLKTSSKAEFSIERKEKQIAFTTKSS